MAVSSISVLRKTLPCRAQYDRSLRSLAIIVAALSGDLVSISLEERHVGIR